MFRPHNTSAIESDVCEDPVQVDVLLGVSIDQIVKMVTSDCQNRLPIELRVVEAVQQMNSTRSRRREAHTQFACVFGVAAGHESCRFFVPDLNETDAVLSRAQRF